MESRAQRNRINAFDRYVDGSTAIAHDPQVRLASHAASARKVSADAHPPTHVSRFLRGAMEPHPTEGVFHELQVEGALPPELQGTLFRVGPNPRYVPEGSYHPFFADGMVYAFRFERGRVSFENRWVRTRRFRLEELAGKSAFDGLGHYVGPALSDTASPEMRLATLSGQNTANTNIVPHAGTLLALSEAGLPYQIDPQSLDTIGPFDFGKTLSRSLTGHPKVDPVSGNLFGFSYGMSEPFLVSYEYRPNGELARRIEIPAPFPSMVHDFAVTENFIVFPIFPVTMRASRALATGSPFGWEPEFGTHVAVLARNGDPTIRWFAADPCYAFHVLNAFDDGSNVFIDLVRYDALPNYFNEPTDLLNTSRLVRWTLSSSAGELRQSTLADTRLEMPQVDARYVGLPYRHGYANSGFRKRMFHAIEHFDVESGARRILDFGDDVVAFEPVVAPRSTTAAEADGFVLAVAGSETSTRTELMVLDAQHIDEGPIARVQLPHRVNGNFHGCWVPGDAK